MLSSRRARTRLTDVSAGCAGVILGRLLGLGEGGGFAAGVLGTVGGKSGGEMW
jgi:hypothetical protein